MAASSSVGTPTHDPSAAWDAFVAGHPLATYLQTAAWARVKAANGWSSRLVTTDPNSAIAPDTSPVHPSDDLGSGDHLGARVLLRRPKIVPWTFAYAPRGPLGNVGRAWTTASLGAWSDALRAAFETYGIGPWGRVAHVRIDPEVELGGPLDENGATRDLLYELGWRPAPMVQPSVTRVVDLRADEAALWSDLRSKWRQYIGRARTGGVTIADIDADADPTAFPTFHRVMTKTSARTGTPIRTEAAYRDIWDAFRPSGGARLLFARAADGEVGAVLLLVRCGSRVVEPYGGMTTAGATLRANYLLKWEAIRSSRELGATSYDLWGLVNAGIRQFKEGFGGREVRLIGAWDLPLSVLGWRAYRRVEGPERPPWRVNLDERV